MEYAIKAIKLNKGLLKDISMKVESSSIYVLAGSNGSGKTQLLKLISGINEKDSGELLIYDESIENLKYRKIGVVFDDFKAYPELTPLENLRLYAKMLVGCHEEYLEKLLVFNKLSRVKNIKTRHLNLIERKYLALSIALVSQPDILILDEPVKDFDKRNMRDFFDHLLFLNKTFDITLVISATKIKEYLEIADHFGIMYNHQLIKEMDQQTLLKNIQECICVKVNDVQKAVVVLENQLNIYDFSSADDNQLFIYDKRYRASQINKLLVDAGLEVERLEENIDGLEWYVNKLVGEQYD